MLSILITVEASLYAGTWGLVVGGVFSSLLIVGGILLIRVGLECCLSVYMIRGLPKRSKKESQSLTDSISSDEEEEKSGNSSRESYDPSQSGQPSQSYPSHSNLTESI